MNDYAEAMIAFENAQLGKPYLFGRRGPNAYDCMGLQYAAARAAGLGPDVFPNSWTVRSLTAWAEAHGHLRLAVDDYQPRRGDLGLWGAADRPDHKPIRGAGHVFMVKRPPSPARPKGRAISAYNPELDIINHGVLPKPGHLALYGYIALPYPAPEPIPAEIEDSAPTTDTVEPADEPTVEELLAKIAAAKAALA